MSNKRETDVAMSPQPLSKATEAIPVSPPVMVIEEDQPDICDTPAKPASRRREWLLDVFAMNSFSWAIAIPIELLLAGMSWNEHLKVRLLAVFFNTVIARPFSLYRNWVVSHMGGTGALRNYMVDTFVFLSFQLPLYIINMALGGASLVEIATASGVFVLIAGALGRPYGMYLDCLRRLWLNKRPAVERATAS
ncbi:L-alanine exporter AlaE [Microbulbifer aggregans]|uniref:L-alanine exporter AlaE n=1 Tax=Microbulbifer aggregans TaxID=1769779 RepID=UPI001CFE9590|nr:L-alanine exporter AlaE [Microbulbifer aggregans]